MAFPSDDQERDGRPACQGSAGSAKDQDSAKGQGGSGDTDTAFARIIAGLELQSAEPAVLHSAAGDADEDPPPPPEPRSTAAEVDHFEPPVPPPLPVPRPRTVGGVLALTVGTLLLAAPSLLGLGERVATPLGLLTLTAGIGWLVIGLRSGPPADGSDDGARL